MPEERFIAVTYPALYRAMRGIVVDALGVVRNKFGDPPKWPDAQFREVSFPSPGGAQWTVVTRPYPAQGLSAVWTEVAAFPSFGAGKSELEKLKDEKKAVGHWMGDLASAYAFPILQKYIEAGFPLTFQEEGFARIYEEIESYLAASTGSVRLFLELRGLESALSAVVLDGNHRILKIDEDTAIRLWARLHGANIPVSYSMYSSLGPARTAYSVLPGNVVLDVTFQFPKERSGELSSFLQSQSNRAATALRLSHPGSGFIGFSAYEHIGFFPESGIFGFSEDLNLNRFSYEIDDGVAALLQKRWPDSLLIADRLQTTPTDVQTHLRLAVERTNVSYDKKVPADRFLDFMMALEALLSSERDAVSYRVALRAGTLIGKDTSERQSVFDLMKGAYDERSNLAHGRPSKLTSSDTESVRAYISQVEQCLARTIHFFIQAEIKKKKKEDVLRLIDAAIATQDRTLLESSLSPRSSNSLLFRFP